MRGVLLFGGNRSHQENYATLFANAPNCTLVGVTDGPGASDERVGLTRALADDLGIAYLEDWQAALRRDDVQLVSMCADVEVRGEVIAAAAAAGKDLYLDKPLAGTVAAAREARGTIEHHGVAAQMYSMIHLPWAKAARAAVAAGELGELLAVHVEVVFAKGTPGSLHPPRPRREQEPERYTFVEAKHELMDIGIYAAGLVCWVAGQQVQQVAGHTGNYFFAEHAAIDLEDFGALTMTLESGATASIIAGRFGWTSHPMDGPKRITLIGTRGAATFDAYRPRLELANPDREYAGEGADPKDPMGMWASTRPEQALHGKRPWLGGSGERQSADVDAFLRAVEAGEPPEMDVALSAHVVEVIIAGYRSAASGKPVALPL